MSSLRGQPEPLVTVITPTFNRADYLRETIDSVLSQNYSNLEYWVLDDGSTDGTPKLLAEYASRLHWQSHPNMGETRTVNRGFALAQGEFIAVVSSDDPVLPGWLQAMVAFLNAHPDILVAYPDWYKIDEGSRQIGEVYRRDYDYLRMLRECICLVGPGAVIRRRALELAPGRDVEFRYVGDFDYWLRLGLHGSFKRVPGTLATHRVHSGSASIARRGVRMAEEHVLMYERLFTRSDLPPAVAAIRVPSLSAIYYMAAAQSLSESYGVARRYFARSFELSKQFYIRSPRRLAYLLSVLLPAALHRRLFRAWKTQFE